MKQRMNRCEMQTNQPRVSENTDLNAQTELKKQTMTKPQISYNLTFLYTRLGYCNSVV